MLKVIRAVMALMFKATQEVAQTNTAVINVGLKAVVAHSAMSTVQIARQTKVILAMARVTMTAMA
jgi:hypothetical protein